MERHPPMPDEDYEAIEAAVMDTARGRWFLAEFARRNRNADTALLLDAIERIERMMALRPAPPAPLALPSPDANPVLAALAAQEQAPTLAAPQPELVAAQPAVEPAPLSQVVAPTPEPAAFSISSAAVEAPPPAPEPVAIEKPVEPPAPSFAVAAPHEVAEIPPTAVAPQEPEPAPVITLDAGEPEWFDDIVWVPVSGDTGPPQTVADAELIAVEAYPAPASTQLSDIASAEIAEIEVQATTAELPPVAGPVVSIQAVPIEAAPVQTIGSEPEPVAEEPANVSFIAPESRLIEAAAPPLVEAEITPLPSGSSPPPVDPADIDAMSFELKSVYFA